MALFRKSILVAFLLLLCLPAFANTLVILGGPSDAELYERAFADFRAPDGISFQAFCLGGDDSAAIAAAKRADVVAVNGHVVELRQLAEELSAEKRVYALPHRRLKTGTKVLAAQELETYRSNLTPANLQGIALWLMKREFNADVVVPPPEVLPECGLMHPARNEWFTDMGDFREWSRGNGKWRGSGIVVWACHSPHFTETERGLLLEISRAFEARGLDFVVAFGNEVPVLKMLSKAELKVEVLLAQSFKYKVGLGKELHDGLAKLNVPVFNILSLYRQTSEQWRESQKGMNDFAVAFGFIAPEASGIVEPTLIYGVTEEKQNDGRVRRVPELMRGNLRQLVSRIAKLVALRRKANAEKKVAIFIYNGAGGKQSIAASGLNVPESLANILGELRKDGYSIDNVPTGDELTQLIIKGARNAGSWAQGEVEALAESGQAVLLPVAEYSRWFAEMPEPLRKSVVAAWGTPAEAKIMMHNGSFVLPMLRLGNVIVLPEPMRGWLDDPRKMLHSKELPPTHQYLAVYQWLNRVFKADAMINLGRHGSSEWLPGKQLGLDSSDAVAFVRSDIPEIYPYISDGIGEGIVAKRRASAVIIDHLTPLFRVPNGELDLADLRRRIAECETADPAAKPQRLEALRAHLRTLPLEINLDDDDWFDEISEYVETRSQPAPYGLHIFGKAPSSEEMEETLSMLPEEKRDAACKLLKQSGHDEMDALMNALSGRFIKPGPSGDTLRRPDMPVGRNFYSFDPAKIPTKVAYEKGKKMAEELLEREKRRLGHYPRTVAIMLWAGEAIRTDGHNESLALALLGMEPTYDKQENCNGVRPIPAARLNRPRIDVLLTASGAYRDQFGATIDFLEKARKQAGALADVENYINANRPAVFFPKQGTYGLRLNRVAGASWLWDDNAPLVQTYLENMAYTTDGELPAQEALKAAVASVESVVQSRSSNVYGVTDIDESFQYLGGLSAAVNALSGNAPSEYIADLRRVDKAKAVLLKNFLSAELDSRLFNREWLARMMKENYSGAAMLSRMVDNLWGWQATSPHLVNQQTWTTAYNVLVEDKYGLGMHDFLTQEREWAYQSIAARMLEATRKGYWTPDENVRKQLAAGYLNSVLRAGMACCDHTCNNPIMNQMVVQLVSVPGGLPSDVVQQFRLAVEKSIGKTLDEAAQAQSELKRQIASGFAYDNNYKTDAQKQREEQAREKGDDTVPVRGFKLKENVQSKDDAQIPASGLEWKVLVAIFAVIAIFAWGIRKYGSAE